MGEFYTDPITKERYKIGVIDDLRYIRLAEYQALQSAGLEGDYLSDPNTLFRFPWPDEDTKPFLEDHRRDLFRTYAFDPGRLEFEHETVTAHIAAQGGGFGLNVFLPCPAGPGFTLPCSAHSPNYPIAIYGERVNPAGNVRTVFTCAYCGAPFSVTPEELDRIKAALVGQGGGARDEFSRQWFLDLADRLRAREAIP